jgi:hypothetical protein
MIVRTGNCEMLSTRSYNFPEVDVFLTLKLLL